MISIDVQIDRVDFGTLSDIGEEQPRSPRTGYPVATRRLRLENTEGDMVHVSAGREAIAMLCAVWHALHADPDDADEATTLADLRRVMADREARIAALYAPQPAQVA